MLERRYQYTSYRDMAYDCISDLFGQDEHGTLPKLIVYFEGIAIDQCDDAELLAHLRRLVLSRVNQEIFRIYGELDPSLSEILRNIKVAIHALNHFSVETRFGETQIIPSLTERNAHLPIIDPQVLERSMSERVKGTPTIPDLLSALALCLREQDCFCRSVPLILVARVFRSIYVRDHAVEVLSMPDDEFAVEDTISAIRNVCLATKQEFGPKYTGKRKVPPSLLEDYFLVVEKSMVHRFLNGDDVGETFYERFKVLRPELTRVDYYRLHRARIEYLARLTHGRILAKLKAEA